MIDRRSIIHTLALGVPGMALASPLIARADGNCDYSGNLCDVGIRTDNFNAVNAKQRASQWCWAACAQMILNYHQVPVTQEDVVWRIKGVIRDEAANYYEIMSALNGEYPTSEEGGRAEVTCLETKSTDDIIDDLYKNWPLMLAYDTGDSGHAVVLTAARFKVTRTQNGKRRSLISLTVRDPSPERPSRQIWDAREMVDRTVFFARVFVNHTEAPKKKRGRRRR